MALSRPFAALSLVLALLAGCTSSTSSPGVSATGAMQLAISLPAALPADVSRVTVTVSGSDMSPLSVDLTLTEGAWGGILGDIPAGPHRTFLAQAYTSSNTLRYQGQANDITVTASTTGLVSLTLQDVSTSPFSNEAPVIDSLVASTTTVVPGSNLSLTATAHDPNPGDTLTYAWSAPSGSFTTPSLATTGWKAPTVQGPVVLTLTVSDSRGASLSMILTVNVSSGTGTDQVTVAFNTAPQMISLTSSQSQLLVGEQTGLYAGATDADGDSLSYQWTATCAGSFTSATSTGTLFTPSALPSAACNNCQIVVTVKDGRGGTNTGSLSLCVANDPRRAPPMLTYSYQSSATAKAGQPLTFEVGTSDSYSSALTYTWTATGGSLDAANSGSSISQVVWMPPACVRSGSTASVTLKVSDPYGLQALKTFTFTGLRTCGPTELWDSTGRMTRPRYGHAAALLPTGKVLVSGGNLGGSYDSSAELYDPATGTWSTTGYMSEIRYGHQLITLNTGWVLAVGGYSHDGYLKTTELYNPNKGSWAYNGATTWARYGHQLTLLANSKVLVSGGVADGTSPATAELYDMTMGTWSSTGALKVPRAFHASSRLSNGKVLVTGGYNTASGYLASAELYDPATGLWSTTSSMAAPRQGHSETLLPSGKVLVTGGSTSGGSLETSELYDPATGTWSPTGSMAAPRGGHLALLLPSGKVLVVGGGNSTGYLATSELYDPATGTWMTAGSMSTPRSQHTATLLSTGKVLVSGGYPSGSLGFSLGTAEVYGP